MKIREHGVRLLLEHEDAHQVALLDDGLARRDETRAEPGEVRDATAGRVLHEAYRMADPHRRGEYLVAAHRTRGVTPERLVTFRYEAAQHLVGGPRHRCDSGDAEAFVHLGTSGVVDACDDVRDAELLAGDARRDDVGVVSAGDRRERIGGVDGGTLEDRTVEASSGHRQTGVRRAEPAEGIRILVDHGGGVIASLEVSRQRGPDAATPHDHDMHDFLPSRSPRLSVDSDRQRRYSGSHMSA